MTRFVAYQAIKSTYHGPTNTRDSKVTARCEGGSVSISWDHEMDAVENHRAAAAKLANKLGWTGQMITGSLRDCYVHVFTI